MTESQLYDRLKSLLYSDGWHLQRIETGSTCVGFPDLLMIKQGRVIFCELKAVPERKTPVVRPPWRPGQLAYLRKLERHKADVMLCIAVGNTFYFSDPFESRDLNELRAAHADCVAAFRLPI